MKDRGFDVSNQIWNRHHCRRFNNQLKTDGFGKFLDLIRGVTVKPTAVLDHNFKFRDHFLLSEIRVHAQRHTCCEISHIRAGHNRLHLFVVHIYVADVKVLKEFGYVQSALECDDAVVLKCSGFDLGDLNHRIQVYEIFHLLFFHQVPKRIVAV